MFAFDKIVCVVQVMELITEDHRIQNSLNLRREDWKKIMKPLKWSSNREKEFKSLKLHLNWYLINSKIDC